MEVWQVILLVVGIIVGLIVVAIIANFYDHRFDHDARGFSKKGIHKNGTLYDDRGYDVKGYNKNGFNAKGVHSNGTKYDVKGYDAGGFDSKGYNIIGVNKTGSRWWSDFEIQIEDDKYHSRFYNKKTIKNSKNQDNVKLFINNHFNVLGLTTGSLSAEINKRVSEISKFAKAEIKKSYDIDFWGELIDRDEKTIKLSRDRLNNIQTKTIASLFWFDFDNKKIKTIILNKNIEIALYLLGYNYQKTKNISFLHSLTLLQILDAIAFNEVDVLKISIKNWNIILDNKKFRTLFEEKIKKSQGYALNDDFFKNFYETAKTHIVEFYFNLTKGTKLVEANDLFYEEFGFLSDAYANEYLIKELSKGQSIVDELTKIETTEISSLNKETRSKITAKINKYLDFIKVYVNRNLEKYPAIRKLNDAFAMAVRNLSVVIHNEAEGSENREFSKQIVKDLLNIHLSDAVRKTILDDIKTVEKMERDAETREQLLNDINSKIENRSYTRAESLIDELEEFDSSYENSLLCSVLRIKIMKSKRYDAFKDAMEEASRLAKSDARNNTSAIVHQLKIAVNQLRALEIIAEKTDSTKELADLRATISNLQSQIYKLERFGFLF